MANTRMDNDGTTNALSDPDTDAGYPSEPDDWQTRDSDKYVGKAPGVEDHNSAATPLVGGQPGGEHNSPDSVYESFKN